MASAKLEGSFLVVWHNQMHHARAILLEGQAFQKQVVGLFGDVLLNVNQAVANAIGPEYVGIWLLADLTLKLLPSVGDKIFLLLLGHLLFQPVLEAIVVDESDRAIALTRVEKWVLRCRGLLPANFALDVCVWVNNTAVDFNNLLFIFLVKRV